MAGLVPDPITRTVTLALALVRTLTLNLARRVSMADLSRTLTLTLTSTLAQALTRSTRLGGCWAGCAAQLVCSAMSKYGKPLAMPSDTMAPRTRKVRAGRVMLRRSTAYLLCFHCAHQVLGGAAPDRIAEINGNEALVSRCRLLARAPHP